jgi:hypothetical protein
MLARKELRRAHPGCRLLHWVAIMLILARASQWCESKAEPEPDRSIYMYDIPALTILMDWVEFDD